MCNGFYRMALCVFAILIACAPISAYANTDKQPVQSAQKPQSAQPVKRADNRPEKRTAMKIPEPGSVLLFGGAILLLLIARRFGRARLHPLPEEKWMQD